MTINELADATINSMVEAMNEAAPWVRRVIVTKRMNKPWMNEDVKERYKDRDRTYRRAIETGSQTVWKEYRKKRNDVVKVMRMNKLEYYEQNIDMQKNDSKNMWRIIKQLIGDKRINDVKREMEFHGV